MLFLLDSTFLIMNLFIIIIFSFFCFEVQGTMLSHGARALAKHGHRSSNKYWGVLDGSGEFVFKILVLMSRTLFLTYLFLWLFLIFSWWVFFFAEFVLTHVFMYIIYLSIIIIWICVLRDRNLLAVVSHHV